MPEQLIKKYQASMEGIVSGVLSANESSRKSQIPPSTRLVQIKKVLRFAAQRGFTAFGDLDLGSGHVTTTGVLLSEKGSRKATRRFATLTDGRDQIQLVLVNSQDRASGDGLDTVQSGARVAVTGVPFLGGRDEATATPSLFVVRLHTESSPAPIAFDEIGFHREVTPRLMMGDMMSLFSAQLEADGYVRYEPRFITSSEVELDTEPLMVSFPGRGVDLFLEVSPLPQLLYAAIMTGKRKLYSPTRLFSRGYRDGLTSADSPIIAAVETGTGDGPISTLEDRARLLLSAFSRAEEYGLPFDPIPDTSIVVGNGTVLGSSGHSAAIRLIDLAAPIVSRYAYDVRRRIEVLIQPGQVLIEGHEGKIAQSIPYNWLSIHVERLALADFWRISQRRSIEP